MMWQKVRENIIAGTVVMTSVVAISWFSRYPVILIELSASEAATPGGYVVERGMIYRTKRDCYSSVEAQIVDGRKIVHKVEPRRGERAVDETLITVEQAFPVPLAAAPGQATLTVQRTYYCWPFYQFWPLIGLRRESAFVIAEVTY